MPRLRLVGDTGRNSDVIPFPSDRVRRGTRPGDSARLVEPTPSRGRTESIRQVEKAMTDVQQNLDELADLLAPLPFDHFARLRRDEIDDDRPRAA